MSLIKCPECGRENVSDTAESCPECGYGIKAHYDKLRKIEEQKKCEREAAERKRNEELEQKRLREERIKSVPKPEKPRISILGIVLTIITFLLGVIQLGTDKEHSMSSGDGDPILFGFLFIIASIVIISVTIRNYYDKYQNYVLAAENFENYQHKIIIERDQQIAKMNEMATMQELNHLNNAKCPYCSSKNTKKITTIDKAVNTAAFGILGQKRKHEWHCNNCNSNF